MRTKQRVLVSAGALAATVLAAGCVPPGGPKPPTTTTQPPKPGVTSCPAVADATPGPNGTAPIGGSWGVNGQAKAVAVIGNVAYVGGTFTVAVPAAGAPAVARSNLAAFCLANGQLLNTFVANFGGGPVNALATDGVNLYVGGNFTTLNGQPSNRLVKLSAAGAKVPNFSPLPIPAPSATPPPNPEGVLSLAYSGGVIYAAGDFGKVGTGAGAGQSTVVDGAAGFNATTGALSGFTAGASPKKVDSIAVSPDGQSVYIGGVFSTVKGQARNNVAQLNTSGAVQATTFGNLDARPLDLAVSADNSRLLAAVGPRDSASAPAGAGRRLVVFNTANGSAIVNDTGPQGDPQAVEAIAPNRAYFGMLTGYLTNNGPEAVGVDYTQPVGGAGYLAFQSATTAAIGSGVRGLAQGGSTRAYFVAVGDFTTMGGVAGLHGVAIFK
jgi:hypothetical protein